MEDRHVHIPTDDELAELGNLPPTEDVDVPVYLSDGKTRKTNEEGKLVDWRFTLERPNAAAGKRFTQFQRGILKKKKLIQPSQQELAIEAIKTCIPRFRPWNDAQMMGLLVQVGGYIGDNAVLANACLRMLGQNLDAGDEEDGDDIKRWADDETVPSSSSS